MDEMTQTVLSILFVVLFWALCFFAAVLASAFVERSFEGAPRQRFFSICAGATVTCALVLAQIIITHPRLFD